MNIKWPGQILDYVDTKEHLLELYNYITNLKQENEKLLSENIAIKSVRNMVDETIYKSRCEKARIYIKKHLESWETEDIQNIRMLDDEFDVDILLNILNGRSDE